MRHKALPEKMTTEQLAQWLTENAVDKRTHTEEVKLSEDDIHLHENKITLATRALYDLADLKKAFELTLKKGTEMGFDEKGDPQRQPATFTIPPTKGTEELEENRKHSDRILKQGFTAIDTPLFGIPYGKNKTIVFFDIEGNEFFVEPMNQGQINAYASPLFDKVPKPLKETAKKIDDLERELFPEPDGKSIGDTIADGLFPEEPSPLGV